MAAIIPSSIPANFRMNPMCLKTELGHLKFQKLSLCSCGQMSFPFPKRSRRLYMVPFNPFDGRCVLKSFGGDSVFDNEGNHPQRDVISGVLDSKVPQRSDIVSETYMKSPGSLNDLEEQLQELFNEVKSLIKLGKNNDAVDLLQANYESVREQVDSGSQGIEEAAVLDVIALGYMALGDLRTVGSLMDLMHKIVNTLDDEEPLFDSILMHMANIYAKLEKFELSIHFYRRSLQIMERKYGTTSSFLCTPLMGIAKVLGSGGRASEAIETYHQVIKILESSRGEGKELIVPLSALGNLLQKEGKTSDAEYTFNRVLNIYIRLFGEKDGRVGVAMCSLAQVKCAKGEVNEAIDLYKNAMEILRTSTHMALDDQVMEKMRIDLAELLHAVGRGEEGRALLEECLFISEKSKGKHHPSLVPHLINLATSYSQSKNFAEAERLLRISLQIMMKNVPPDDPSITFPMLNLAVTLYNLRRDEEAEELAADVLYIREKAFGKESLPVGETLDCLVSIRTRMDKDDGELVELLKRVLKIQEKAFGPDSEEVMETVKKIVHYLDKLGIKDEKYPLQRRLSAPQACLLNFVPSPIAGPGMSEDLLRIRAQGKTCDHIKRKGRRILP
ncbi:Tetratricopeptide repeat superfamily protein [Perilla frutescens var. frutescens]|nr:Tetratricopeptide repeat superfamily protein [Perilla frutescens var. frutescens]